MLVDQLMTKEVYSCSPDERMSDAAQILWEHDCGCVPILQDDLGVIGIVTDRDICMAAYTQGLPLREMSVASAMSRNVQTCSAADTVSTAEKTMRTSQIRRLPVVDESNRLVGLLSLNDIARNAADGVAGHSRPTKDEVADTLASICTPRLVTAATA